MKYFILIAVLSVCESRSDVAYTTEPTRKTAGLTVQTTLGRRDGRVVHRIRRFNRPEEGELANFVETFYIDTKPVLSLSRIQDGYMIDSRGLGAGFLSLYCKVGTAIPSVVVVGASRESAEVYVLAEGDLHAAAKDSERPKLMETFVVVPTVETADAPNQSLEATSFTVMPAAGAPGTPVKAVPHH